MTLQLFQVQLHAAFRFFVEFLRRPEWVAALALLIQAFILGLQAKILRKHGATMETHAQIAGKQAETAELIGKALAQQERILDEQTKIMAQQFEFQRAAMGQADRQRAFDSVLSLRKSLDMLISKIQSPGQRYPDRIAEEQRMQTELLTQILPLHNALLSTIHLTPEEKEYFGAYSVDVLSVVSGDANFPARLPQMKQVQQQYSEQEFLRMVAKIGKAQEPADNSRDPFVIR